jgi:putative nucleotidyltransferase with HDIG domain
MNRLAAICDSPEDAKCVRQHLQGIFETQCVSSFQLAGTEPPSYYSIIGVDLAKSDRVRALKQWLGQRPKHAKLAFIVDKGSRLEAARAYAVGATHLVHRPIDANALLTTFFGDFKLLSSASPEFEAEASPGIAAALTSLQDVFISVCSGETPDQVAIDKAGERVIEEINSDGMASWVEIVRKHHSQTYQHSLLVTGLAVGFGRHLGFSRTDLKRLAIAGILHDVGKAKIPVAILEKPSVLDNVEVSIMKQHPALGSEALATASSVPKEVVDAVLHHHEYLDGTGYPHGLKGGEIADFVRVLTIADIFGALIERRSYKAPLSGAGAYQVLLNMGPKLDRDLVREFREFSRVSAGAA